MPWGWGSLRSLNSHKRLRGANKTKKAKIEPALAALATANGRRPVQTWRSIYLLQIILPRNGSNMDRDFLWSMLVLTLRSLAFQSLIFYGLTESPFSKLVPRCVFDRVADLVLSTRSISLGPSSCTSFLDKPDEREKTHDKLHQR